MRAGWRQVRGWWVDHAVALRVLAVWCRLAGHRWGPDHDGTEWAGYPVHVATWHECLRCERYEELWSIYDVRVG